MVRETRHLWVGNLPDNIREDRIREHFKRYGRVQNVKLLGRTENAVANASAGPSTNASGATISSGCGICATVAFMDIKSASKAHNAEHVLDERTLTTEYYEPAAIPSATGAPSAGSSPAGSGYSGSSSSVNSAPAPISAPRYHLSGGEENSNNACAMATAAAPANWRGTNDSATEYCRRGNTPASYGRTTPHHRWYGSAERTGGATGGESTPSTPGAPEGRRRRNSGSGTSRSDSSSPEPSDTSRASTPAASHNHHHHTNHRLLPPHHQWAATASGRPLAICVRNLPTRSTDSSLKDGLYHEYKKHGKVVWVKVVGQNADRYAVVRFKKPSDVEKALEVSQDKLFFGCKISVAPHQSCDEDADTAKPYETDIDEYHPKATKTLFIGNLEKDVTQQQLREKFKHFGRIIEIDIKKGSSGGAGYAFCQYASISSVVEAIRVMDGEYVGGSRVKLGFGKPVATTCVWVDGLSEHTEKQVLGAVARCGAATSVCVDRAAGAALVHFEQAAAAGAAVRELRRVAALASAMEPDHPRLCVDYASRECQDAFYEQLEKHGGSAALASSERLSGDVSTRYAPSTRHDSLRYDGTGPRSRGSSYGRASSRTPRYSSIEHYDPAEYAADRRYRVYEELGSSPPAEETPYEDRLQSVVVSPHRARRHRRDSTPEERKHSKERHRSAGVRRSRSGSRRHRRRREGSGGTPLRDELDVPVEPRRPPRDRPPLPMSLPLPKFAAQLLRTAPTAPRPAPTPAPAPASPPRPPSASSSSGGSAPHSPSLEERIRSLNEKYEKWNGSRAAPDAPDRSRLRHRLLEVDINEVKPSEVVRSLLAKRSVFDEDSERLEGATRAPSPAGSPRPRSSPSTPRSHRYSFPTHLPAHGDPRLERPERPYKPELLTKLNELDYGFEPRSRHRTPSTDKSQIDTSERRHTPPLERDRANSDRECKKETDIGDSLHTVIDNDSKFDSSARDTKNIVQVPENDYQNSEKIRSTIDEILESSERTITAVINEKMNVPKEHVSVTGDSFTGSNVFELKSDCLNISPSVQNCNPSEDSSIKSDFGIKCEPLKSEESKPLDSDNKFYFSKYPVKSDDDKCKDIFIQNHIKKELAEFEAQQNKLNISNTIKSIKGISDTSHDIVKVNEKNNKERFNQNVILEAIQNNKLEKENIHSDKLPEEEKQTSSNTVFFDSKMFVSEKVAEDKSKIDCDKTRTHKDRLDKDKHNLEKTITSKSEKMINKNDTKEKNLKEDNHEDLRHSIDKTDKNKVERDIEKLHKGKGDRDSERSIRDYDKFNNDNEKSNRDTEKCSRDHEKSNRDSEKSTRDSDKSNRDSEKSSRDSEKSSRDFEKSTRELEKSKHSEEKLSRTDHHRKEKLEKDKRKDNMEFDFLSKVRRDEKYKHDRTKKDIHDSKRDRKDVDSIKNRKSSRDETSRDLCRKDSTDSSASRTSHDSARLKDFDHSDMKDEIKVKLKSLNEGGINKIKNDKDLQMKNSIINCTVNCHKLDESVKLKPDEKGNVEETSKSRSDHLENIKPKDLMDKQRHYSLDSPSVDSKRKERLNSCSSLPSNISYKRRMSSQDSFDSLNEESKKVRNETKVPERRDSRDNRSLERHKTTKFNKGHFAKIIESKTKDDKKNQVKPPDANCTEWRSDIKDLKQTDRTKLSKRSPKGDHEEKFDSNSDIHHEGLQNDLDFLATLELRSSEEDEKQRALRKEMKEKKRIQQLQQIQELQMKQDALQQAEIVNKLKEDKKQKADEKKKEIAREKRFSTDRKSREDKIDPHKRKNRKQMQSTDSSDSDEPKKHSIFDIVDDEPTYISMYDKVKARSCKNMQKQEEEKRQEKIKAKFSQLKQSRAKREEKKRSSWDEDSDSDHERRKLQKSSMGSSSDDEQNKKRNKPHRLSLDYDCNKSSDFFYLPNNEEDSRNKLSRKNSRTRIMSDSSDDEVTKRSSSKSPNYLSEVKKELISDSETLLVAKDDIDTKRSNCDRIKKSSLLNLFGKSDSDDIKIKPRLELDNDYKSGFLHLNCNDFSSESESVISNRLSEEIRKKHKRKQKKHKFSFSDDEIKKGNNETTIIEDTGNKHSEKPRRHSNKKDKRKDKNRESFDTDETRDEKVKLKKKKSIMSNFDVLMDIPTNSIKKEGKMEDIFGPLSDESDKERSRIRNNSVDYNCYDISYHTVNDEIKTLYPVDEAKLKERDDNKRKKEKRRKEKRYIAKDDENSLDVDAVSKAIEARLFADTISDDDNRVISESHNTVTKYDQKDLKHPRNDSLNESINDHSDKNIDKVKKDFREKKKKKKKYREDRQSRKDHQYFHHHDAPEKSEHSKETSVEQTISQNNLLLDIPLPKDAPVINANDDTTDSILLETSSLPRLTESPPGTNNLRESTDMKSTSDTIDCLTIDENESKFITCNNIEMKDIPMPPPIENMVQDINSVPLPSEPLPILPINSSELSKSDNFPPSFVGDDEISENAVRSISNLENEIESTKTKNDSQTCKPEDIIAEKPRAIISQEETEDAVAALLGESFGGKDNTFETRYEEVQTNTSIKTEIGSSIIENENIPEEDAEEMRQAVQNLNASEMEVKPDTPVSDNDLLLIDTDTEETDEPPINAKATNQTLSINITDQPKTTEMSNTDNNILLSKPKSTVVLSTPNELGVTGKPTESDIKIALTKREPVQQATSTATPVITSWTLANHKLIDPHVLNIQKSQLAGRESESKSNVTANIVQLKGSQNQPLQMNTPPRPIITSNRINAPSYQVINQMMRPQISNMQPPTIKIPEPHILYQKSQGIVISPRTSNDVRLQSPKASPQNENITSPRLANMTILSTSPPVINSVGIPSPNALQQRSPGQVTVVRMQQPPLSPIQAVHLPPGARAMVSPNRPNSVLVQQGTPIHFNRLPVTPVLAPISKQITSSAIVQQNKGIVVNSSPLIHQQKVITAGDFRKNDPRIITDSVNESSKIILSPTNLQQSTNPTVMAQNRLISMQNAMLINNMNQMNEKRDHIQKPEQHNHISFNTTPIIHVTAVNHSTASIIHSATKSAMCSIQEGVPLRGQTSNVIHTLNSQKLLTTTPMSNVIQLEKNKTQPSVLSMATIRPPSVLTKLESSKSVAITTSTLTNVVMTPLLLKSTNASGTVRLNTLKQEKDFLENKVLAKPNHLESDTHEKNCSKISTIVYDSLDKHRDSPIKPTTYPMDHLTKCETDFEELLKDNTNEIKISNDTEKKLEINVGKIVTLLPTTAMERKPSIDSITNEIFNKDIPITKEPATEVQISDNDAELVNGQEENQQNSQDSTVNATQLGNAESEKVVTENITRQDEVATSTNNNDLNKISKEINVKHTFKTHEVSVTTCGDKSAQSGNSNIQIKNFDEVGLRSTKDINVESVIKKVDVLCHDLDDTKDMKNKEITPEVIKESSNNLEGSASINKPELTAETKLEHVSKSQPESNVELDPTEGLCIERGSSFHKRGGRSGRGKRSEKNPDRVQTRQIAKPPRNATSAKRGRGRAKLDKKIKNIASNMTNNIPGDVYDFHEDSGEEDSTSSNKSETRPRLILTIKSPLSGNCNAIATSTLSITQKDQLKGSEKLCKNEKAEDFASPSLNTRKSRRLQEKDVARGSGEDSGENSSPVKIPRENKKKSPKQGGPKGNQIGALDTRKSPRGAKRTRDRSLSTASIDSNEDKLANRADDGPREAKVPKLADSPSKIEVDSHALPKSTSVISSQPAMSPAAPAPAPTPAPIPMPIMKPPKKMISEIAKLGGAFEGTPLRGLASPNVLEPSTERTIGDNEKQAAGGERRLVDNVPVNMVPVGATEATDARVQSPALPHVPQASSAPHRPADRATPILIRGGESEGCGGVAGVAAGAGVCAGGVAAGARGAGSRGFVATPSLPRGAHLPTHPHHAGSGSRVNITSIPTLSPQGPGPLGEGMYFSHQHYHVYQHHFRATQHENRATPPYTRSLEAEGSEAPTPPLELRRPPTARVPRPAHSPLPADRHIMYAAGCGRSPPPAHGTSRLPGALPPLTAPGPPHASQVPREADSLQMLLRRYPVMWQGLLALKNDSAAVQMHFVGGNPRVAGETLPRHTDGSTPPLRIAQRMRLEPIQLDQVHRKMKVEHEHCILLALPCGRDHMDVLQQSTNLTAGFITYMQRKQAAGIVNIAPPGHDQALYTVHIFPSCDFANEKLSRIAPDLMHRVADIAHLLIVIATV